MSYSFALLDPRPTPDAETANDRAFAVGSVLGIEVTVPALVQRCSLGNLDPQHTGGNASRAAIQDALECPIPPPGSVLVTIRPDLDAIGAMAIIQLRASNTPIATETTARVRRIAAADCFAHGPWPGPLLSLGGKSPSVAVIPPREADRIDTAIQTDPHDLPLFHRDRRG